MQRSLAPSPNLLEKWSQSKEPFLVRPIHPDPGPNVKVQVWETGASENWRFFESFFWYPTFHRRSQKSQTLGASESFAPLFRASEIFAPVFKIKPGKTLRDLLKIVADAPRFMKQSQSI